jgi:hypothetical protein
LRAAVSLDTEHLGDNSSSRSIKPQEFFSKTRDVKDEGRSTFLTQE